MNNKMLYGDFYTANKGIFYYLSQIDNDYITNIIGDADDVDTIDNMLFLFYRRKIITENIRELFKETDEADSIYEMISKAILMRFRDTWQKLFNLFQEQYNILETGSRTITENIEYSDNIDKTNDTDKIESKNSFNSTAFVDRNKETTNNTDNQQKTSNTNRDFTETKESDKYTKPELLEVEIGFRQRNNFYNILIKDVINSICIEVY